MFIAKDKLLTTLKFFIGLVITSVLVYAEEPKHFPDVPVGFHAEEAISIAVKAGIILGKPDGNFAGESFLTRYDAAVMAAKLIEIYQADLKILYKDTQLLDEALGMVSSKVVANSSQLEHIENSLKSLEAKLNQLIKEVKTPTSKTITQPNEVKDPPKDLKPYFLFGVAPELNKFKIPVRIGTGLTLVDNFGARLTLDAGRQASFSEQGLTSLGATLQGIYTIPLADLKVNLGAGLGYATDIKRIDVIAGPFLSFLLGAEYPLTENLALEAALTFDYYLSTTGYEGNYSAFYLTALIAVKLYF